MIKFVDEKKYDLIYKKFSIVGNSKFLFALKYANFKSYLRYLGKVFDMFVTGLYYILISPFALIYTLFTFIPILIIKKKVK